MPQTPDLHLLLVDDEPTVRESVSGSLRRRNVLCELAASAADARRALREHPQGFFDVILLDIDMPGGSGWELLDDLRSRDDSTPVIFVTGLYDVKDRVRGLSSGADDYVVKPFDPSELVARIQAVVRRRRALPVLVDGDLRLDLGRRTAHRGEQRIELSPREFDLLRVLMEARGRVVERAVLLREVWGMDFDPGTTVVEVLVARLRAKLDPKGQPRRLQTVPGQGYRLVTTATDRP